MPCCPRVSEYIEVWLRSPYPPKPNATDRGLHAILSTSVLLSTTCTLFAASTRSSASFTERRRAVRAQIRKRMHSRHPTQARTCQPLAAEALCGVYVAIIIQGHSLIFFRVCKTKPSHSKNGKEYFTCGSACAKLTDMGKLATPSLCVVSGALLSTSCFILISADVSGLPQKTSIFDGRKDVPDLRLNLRQ